MIVSTVLVPCLEWGNGCRLDWQAISALGSWAAAAAALVAAVIALNLASTERREREARSDVDALLARIAIGPHADRAREELVRLVGIYRFGVLPALPVDTQFTYNAGKRIENELRKLKELRRDLKVDDAIEISGAIALADELAGKARSLRDMPITLRMNEWDQARRAALCEKGEEAAGVFALFSERAKSAAHIGTKIANAGRRQT